MHATEFLRSPSDALPCVVALTGGERALKGSAIKLLVDAVLDGDDDSPTRFTGKDTDMKSVRDELLTISMWSDRRVVIVDEASDFVTAHRPALEIYAESPAKKSLLILDVKSLPKNTRLYKIINKSGLVVDCSELKGAALSAWIQDTARHKYEKSIARDAVSLLITLAGTHLAQLDQELQKLTSYVGDHKTIDAEAVRRLVGGWKAETTWAMTDAVRDGRLGDALAAFERLIGSGESPHRILGGIAYVFRKLSTATELARQGLTLNAALQKAGAFPHEIGPASQYLRRIGRPRAERISEWLLTADTSLKGGSRISERAQIELLLVQLAGEANLV